MKVKRFGISIENELADRLDEIVRRHRFPNRSQAIRHLIRKNLVETQWQANQTVAGCVTLVYDHHRRGLLEQLTHIQHDYTGKILASQHIHLDHHNCLEMIALTGKAQNLRDLADRLIAVKGVKHGELTMIMGTHDHGDCPKIPLKPVPLKKTEGCDERC
ncbi:MAG: nickel-responsive transcriptional regulator NikR [Candidatus Omnitrophica bacterium]|nr:nickel-responsive transcriptional regulator NikR [Candidatus Omnitrophota bacterium]